MATQQQQQLLDYEITQGNEEVLLVAKQHHNDVVLLDFYADWCGPCKRIAPQVHELVERYATGPNRRLVLCSINVDTEQNEDVVGAYGVQAMPTFVWIRNMHTVDRLEGANINALSQITARHAADDQN